ncbi:Hsp33 family molecular chaperone HslO [Colwellia hornerae]|uniref:33 kDa chaperonin n=1 Tax=Colwellia hornerae TaxID=89402 RepID=A0A5C6QFC8_9GAMM|nr:Hsp33 family molecular chaperone HslO [Colwellia hornerae]TWX55237.1 Hsp33 family molecular chaperone HslO [Colwellia hornerae]TWX61237.1 Hsp33 family molecular chaperone HslO [Colwellia hornerae]TWX67716.1 Hsp33 family molecular chaperone HslO [Colwellia hornerae]
MTVKTDVLNRYLFDGKHARGELVQLTKAYQEIIALHEYPLGVQALLGELVAATCLLTATLKFEGEITVQLQGNGPISYMSVNGDDKQNMRGIARLAEPTDGKGLRALIGNGTMVITIRPEKGEPYQGVVALDKDNLADCLAHYFEVSEQIPTKIWLFNNADNTQVAGSLIQLLPDSDSKETQLSDFEHLCQLTNTIKAEEIFSLDAEDLLYRLYHQEEVRLFEPQSVNYQCSCSEEKCLTAISQVSPSELTSIIAEQGCVSMTCEYCLTTYKFDEPKLAHFINEPKH